MTETTPPPPDADATPDQIEADIAATRARLADSVDALADKVNVKARAQDKVAEVKTTAREKVADVKASAQEKVADVKASAQERVAGVKATVQDKVGGSRSSRPSTATAAPSRAAAPVGAREKVTAGSQQVLARVQGLPQPAQLGLIGASTLLLMILLTRPRPS